MARASASSIKAQIGSYMRLADSDPSFSFTGKTPSDIAQHFNIPTASARRAQAGYTKTVAPRTKLEQTIAADLTKKKAAGGTPPKGGNAWLTHVRTSGIGRFPTARQGDAGQRFGYYNLPAVPSYQSIDIDEDGNVWGTRPTEPAEVQRIEDALRDTAAEHPTAWSWFEPRHGSPVAAVAILGAFKVTTVTVSGKGPPQVSEQTVYYNTGYHGPKGWNGPAQMLAEWMEQFLSPPPGSGSFAMMDNVYLRTTHRLDAVVDAVADEKSANAGDPLESTYWG